MKKNNFSHMDDNVNSMIIEIIEEIFGKLSRTTGKNHTLLGMDIKFIGTKKVAVSMQHQVGKALEYFGETLKVNVVNPATSQIFTITSEAKDIDDERKESYHSITTKILWTMKCSWPDL